MEEEQPVRRVGDYEFLDRLAVGGMGELWRVRHVTLGAVYVAKQLRPEYREDPEFLKRFLHEARLVANLRHPNIVQVFGYDEEHTLYLMEYVKGVDLDHLLRSKRILEFPEKRVIIEAVADTIGYAHREVDLIHRDIKPSNVLIEIAGLHDAIKHTSIKLTDFGIARLMSLNKRVTMATGMVMGTLHYMAPEQFEGHAAKPSDVYSIGILYYQLLTGTLPFDGPTAFVIRDKHVSEIPPAPHELNPEVPDHDSAIVMKCLEKDPAHRFRDSAELYDALMHPQGGTAAIARTQAIPAAPIAATQIIEPQSQPSPRTGTTEKTLLTPGAKARPTTAPPATPTPSAPAAQGATRPTDHTLPASLERPTEETLHVAPKPRRARRLTHAVLVVLAILIGLPLLATQLLRPRYEIAWSTLRSDPLDTPNGIQVAVSPRPTFGLYWWAAGTIGDKAPPNWANWSTWFDRIDVRFSDGLYRHFVLTCTKDQCTNSEGQLVFDFGGASFEQLAETRSAKLKEDPNGVASYINAVLVPKRIATAHSLPDVRRCLDRVGGLLAKAKGVDIGPTQLDAYRQSVARLLAAASALADGNCDEAETRLKDAQAAIEKIDLAGLTTLPDDFLFHHTLAAAIPVARLRAAKADRLTAGLDTLTESQTSVDYTIAKHRAAALAVAQHVLATPGHTSHKAILTKAANDAAQLESLIEEMAGGAPAPLRMVTRYLARLDALVAHTPPPAVEAAFRLSVLGLTDQLSGTPPPVERADWLDKCFAPNELAAPDLIHGFWQKAHQLRFNKALTLCQQLAAKRLDQAAAGSAAAKPSRNVLAMFQDAQAALDAIRKTVHASAEQKQSATRQLAACCVKHAIALFATGHQLPGTHEEHLAAVRRLLDRGLDELPGCPPDAQRQARTLREILKAAAPAGAALAACSRANFATRGAYPGRVETLFAALSAYERLAAEMKKHTGHPAVKAALAPFTHLSTSSCQGFTLWDATATWLLANAQQACTKVRYHEAASHLQAFLRSPRQGAQAGESPLARLLPPGLVSQATALHKVAACFDDTKVPQGTQRAKRLWDARLQAESLLPPLQPTPKPAKGEHVPAIRAQMHALFAHYRNQIVAEKALRKLEAEAGALVARRGTAVKATNAATPRAIHACTQAIAALRASPHYRSPALATDHKSRLAGLQRDLAAVATTLSGQTDRIEALLASADAKAALDALLLSGAAVGKTRALDLTRKAAAAWAKTALAPVDAAKFAEAVPALKAIVGHKQLRQHAADATIRKILDDAGKASAYCEGQVALARGAEGFAEALASFRKAAPYRDAAAIAAQIGPIQEASGLAAKAPFKAWGQLSALLKNKELPTRIKDAAAKAGNRVRQHLIADASKCTDAFGAALVVGGWEKSLDRAGIPDDQIARIRTFLAQVEDLKVQQTAAPDQGTILGESRQVRIKRKRLLTFRYKLADGTTLPAKVEQMTEWTLRHVPDAGRWVIEGWEEAY